MNDTDKDAVLLTLIERLLARGSWCGETHVQKAAYFLEALCEVPLELGFTLYKHGPFSFELRERLAALRADGLVDLHVVSPGYGLSIQPTEAGTRIARRAQSAVEPWVASIGFVAGKLGNTGVGAVERIATALYVANVHKKEGHDRAAEINRLKPHVGLDDALRAVADLDAMRGELVQVQDAAKA